MLKKLSCDPKAFPQSPGDQALLRGRSYPSLVGQREDRGPVQVTGSVSTVTGWADREGSRNELKWPFFPAPKTIGRRKNHLIPASKREESPWALHLGRASPSAGTIDLPSLPCCCDTRWGHALLPSEKGQPTKNDSKHAIFWREDSTPSPQSSSEGQQTKWLAGAWLFPGHAGSLAACRQNLVLVFLLVSWQSSSPGPRPAEAEGSSFNQDLGLGEWNTLTHKPPSSS